VNLLTDLPPALRDEVAETLVRGDGVRVERIVSRGQRSPDGFWYDQDEHEWVTVLQGAARLRFEDGERELRAGDALLIEAHRRHRVEWTDPDRVTVWLAVFFRPGA